MHATLWFVVHDNAGHLWGRLAKQQVRTWGSLREISNPDTIITIGGETAWEPHNATRNRP